MQQSPILLNLIIMIYIHSPPFVHSLSILFLQYFSSQKYTVSLPWGFFKIFLPVGHKKKQEKTLFVKYREYSVNKNTRGGVLRACLETTSWDSYPPLLFILLEYVFIKYLTGYCNSLSYLLIQTLIKCLYSSKK